MRRGVVAVGCAGLLAVSTAAVLTGSPPASKLVSLLSGHGWVTNDSKGAILLTNGETGRVDLNLTVRSESGQQLKLVQAGDQTELLNLSNGQMGTIDLNSFGVTNETSAGQSGDIDVQGATDAVYVTHLREGVVDARDPLTNQLLGSVKLGGPVTPGIVDQSGRLWVVQTSSGDLDSVGLSGRSVTTAVHHHVVAPGASVELSSVNGEPAVLNTTANQFFAAPDGVPGPAVQIQARTGQIAVVAPAIEGATVPVAVSDPDAVELITGTNAATVPLAQLGQNELGAPIPFAGRVYLPDFSTGKVVVLDSAGQPTGTTLTVARPGDSFTVNEQNGALFAFNPTGSTAWTVDSSGAAHSVNEGATSVPTNVHPHQILTPKPPVKSNIPPVTNPVSPTTVASSGHPVVTETTAPPPVVIPLTVAASPPSTPGSVTAQAGDGSVDLSWAPSTAHGSPVTGYTISWSAGNGGSVSVSAASTQTTINGLSNGVPYTFSIIATSQAGSSGAALSQPVTPTEAVPPTPTQVTATANPDGSVDLSWTEEAQTVSPIASYTVFAHTQGSNGGVPIAHPTTTSVHLDSTDGLVVGQTYTFTVDATNDEEGTSAPSDPSPSVTPHTPPLAVTDLQATVSGSGTATVQWTCDSSCAGGSQLTGFQVEAQPSSGAPITDTVQPNSGSAYSTALTGLQGGDTYTVTVTATNQVGPGQAAKVSLGAETTPTMTISSAAASGLTITVSVSTSDNGASVSGCSVTVANVGTQNTSGDCNGQSFQFSAPTYNTSYPVTGSIGSDVGSGSASATAAVGDKTLSVNASPWFGQCTGSPPPKYCGSDAHSQAGPSFDSSNEGPDWAGGTNMQAECYETGGNASAPATGTNSTIWIETTADSSYPWMNDLYFPNSSGGQPDAQANLPAC